MARKLRLGIAIVFVFALAGSQGAVSASAASAFTVGTSPATIEAAQSSIVQFKFGAGGTTAKCTTATLKATSTTTTITSLVNTPAFSGCTLTGLEATITTGSCTFTLESTATVRTMIFSITGCVSPLKIQNSFCTITIPSGPTFGEVALSNTGETPAAVLATLHVSSIAYTGSAGCPSGTTGSRSDGAMTGSYRMKAFQDFGTHAQIAMAAD